MANAALTVGRVGIDVIAGGGVEVYPDLSWDGDRLSFSGDLIAGSAADARSLRAQLNGYGPHNTDEPIVPVTWSVDDTIDGYFRVMSSTVSDFSHGSYLGGKTLYRFELDLERVPGWQAPLFEVQTSGAVRDTNGVAGPGYGAVTSFVGVPPFDSLLHHYAFGSLIDDTAVTTNDIESHEVVLLRDVSTSREGFFDNSVQFSQTPANFYDGAAFIEASDDGTNWFPVTGRQTENRPSMWRMGNGLIRWTTDSNSGFTLSAWSNGSTTYHDKGFRVVTDTNGDPGPPATVTVLRNDPAAVSARVWFNIDPVISAGLDISKPVYADFTIRRSTWWVEGRVSAAAQGVPAPDMGLRRSVAEQAVSDTTGIYAASADADGNIYQIRSPQAVTKHNTNGYMVVTGADYFNWMVGYQNKAGGSTIITRDLYFAAMRHNQRIVAR